MRKLGLLTVTLGTALAACSDDTPTANENSGDLTPQQSEALTTAALSMGFGEVSAQGLVSFDPGTGEFTGTLSCPLGGTGSYTGNFTVTTGQTITVQQRSEIALAGCTVQTQDASLTGSSGTAEISYTTPGEPIVLESDTEVTQGAFTHTGTMVGTFDYVVTGGPSGRCVVDVTFTAEGTQGGETASVQEGDITCTAS